MSLRQTDQKIRLGSPIGSHVFLLRESKMLPLRTLFEVDHKSPHYNESKKQSIFYAQSWALAHYLNGRVSREQIEAYVGEVLAGKDPVESFERLMGRSCAKVEEEIKAHLESLK